jgi:NAD-dependent deacetylase
MIFEGELKAGLARLNEILAQGRIIVPFTGAGISTEAGIPDFRSPGGLWTVNKPIPFEDFIASAEARREAWRRRFAMDEAFAKARPTRGHRTIARWVAEGRSPAVITQNIDNLHQDSGVPGERVVEIHGNTTYATCLACGARHGLAFVRERLEAAGEPPPCRACGGILKTATVSFGQAMPQDAMRRAMALAGEADVLIAIGSSLVVHPAASLPVLAARSGAALVIVNREATPLDDLADLVIRGEIGNVLDDYVQS